MRALQLPWIIGLATVVLCDAGAGERALRWSVVEHSDAPRLTVVWFQWPSSRALQSAGVVVRGWPELPSIVGVYRSNLELAGLLEDAKVDRVGFVAMDQDLGVVLCDVRECEIEEVLAAVPSFHEEGFGQRLYQAELPRNYRVARLPSSMIWSDEIAFVYPVPTKGTARWGSVGADVWVHIVTGADAILQAEKNAVSVDRWGGLL